VQAQALSQRNGRVVSLALALALALGLSKTRNARATVADSYKHSFLLDCF
jgi:hypothetical protein